MKEEDELAKDMTIWDRVQQSRWMASPGTLRPLFPNVWKIDLLLEMGQVVFAETFFFMYLLYRSATWHFSIWENRSGFSYRIR